MNVVVNNETVVLQGTTVEDLARQLNLPDKGIAIAVEMKMVTRNDWAATPLSEGANIIVIRAASGG